MATINATCRKDARGNARGGCGKSPRRGFCALLAVFPVFFWGGNPALAQTVKNVTARQRWPWNNLVDIDYTVEGATNAAGQADGAGLYIRFEIADGAKTNIAAAFDPPFPPVTDGAHRVTWDPGADGVRLKSAGVSCHAALFRDDPRRYLVIDLSGGKIAWRYPVAYLPGISGWTEEYKTEKLVLRKIDPGTFPMGSPAGEAGRRPERENLHSVILTNGFYIGVFEVTQRQWELVMGSNPSYYRGDSRPVEMVSYKMIRGGTKGSRWPKSPDVDPNSFIGRLRARTGLDWLDLPTEAQWEYACRAGTTNALNNGKNLSDETSCPEMDDVGRYKHNGGMKEAADGGWVADRAHARVGSYRPGAWGLYDMHGNVWEWCLDRYREEMGSGTVTEPPGAGTGSYRIIRGGGWGYDAKQCRSAHRLYRDAAKTEYWTGLRLAGVFTP